MNTYVVHRSPGTRQILGTLLACIALLCGCHKAPPELPKAGDQKVESHAQQEQKPDGVTLTPDQIRAIGVVAQSINAAHYTEEIAGFGTVLAHDTIAQAVAELATADAAERQSSAALQRTQRLSGTVGANSADVEEVNLRQSAVDKVALALARQRVSSAFGQDPPWKQDRNAPLLQELANGTIKLVRATFPLGALTGGTPKSLRATRIEAGRSAQGWRMGSVWSAPADANVPGRSFYALLRERDVGEGERLQVWAPVGADQTGVLIPSDAVVISEGKYWCYIERAPGTYVRIEIDASKPLEEGYFVTAGVATGDRVVTKGAGQLLAQESGSGAGGD